MLRFVFITVSVLPLVAAAAGGPVAKIGDTLNNLLTSVEQESAEDVANYRGVYGWCKASFDTRKTGLQHYTAIVNELQTKITVQTAQNRQLKDEIQQLEKEIGEWKQAVEEGGGLRGSEHSDYLSEQKDAANILSTLNRAVDVISRSSSRATLLSVANSVRAIASSSQVQMNEQQRQSLDGFFSDISSNGQNGVAGRDDVIQDTSQVKQTLSELIQTFQNSISTATDQERSALDQYDSLIKIKKDNLVELVSSKDAKDALLAESLQKTAQLKRSVADAKTLQQDGKAYLKTLTKVCNSFSNAWAGKSQIYQDITSKLQGVENSLQQAIAQQQNGAGVSMDFTNENKNSKYNSNNNNADGLNIDDVLNVQAPNSWLAAPVSFLQVASKVDSGMDMDMEFSMVAPDAPSAAWAPLPKAGSGQKTKAVELVRTPKVFVDASKKVWDEDGTATITLKNTSADPLESQWDIDRSRDLSLLQSGSSASSSGSTTSSAQNTYTAVKNMVEQMIKEIRNAAQDEKKHKNWCDSEMAKNRKWFNEKNAKLKRLNTKVDNEKQTIQEVNADLTIFAQEEIALKSELISFAKLRLKDRQNFMKYQQSHQMAEAILSQAVNILQRFEALVEENKAHEKRRNPLNMKFLSAAWNQAVALNQESPALNLNYATVIQNLNDLETRYTQLKEALNRAEQTGQLNLNALKESYKTMALGLQATKNYRGNLKLQQMSELDSDNEDSQTLLAQVNSVKSYVSRLQGACKDILSHYDERSQRRQGNLRALEEARNVINIDNADEIHSQLTAMANSANTAAASLLSQSAQTQAISSTLGLDSVSLPEVPKLQSKQQETTAEHSINGDMLGDLQSLQDMASSEESQLSSGSGSSTDSIDNMLPAV